MAVQKARFQLMCGNETVDEYIGKDLRHFEFWANLKYPNWKKYYTLNIIYC